MREGSHAAAVKGGKKGKDCSRGGGMREETCVHGRWEWVDGLLFWVHVVLRAGEGIFVECSETDLRKLRGGHVGDVCSFPEIKGDFE